MMKTISSVLAATALMSGLAGSAEAAVTVGFTPGASISAGYNAIQDFNNSANAPYGLTGSNYIIHAGSPNDTSGAAPNSSGTPYLAVLGGGTATYTFANAVKSIEFDWGTASSDNLLTILTTAGNFTYSVPNSAPGSVNYQLNGLLTATATSGAITGLTFTTTNNSFEVDNISTAVPEPASWALMVGGFGLLGTVMRRRRLATPLVSLNR